MLGRDIRSNISHDLDLPVRMAQQVGLDAICDCVSKRSAPIPYMTFADFPKLGNQNIIPTAIYELRKHGRDEQRETVRKFKKSD